ncbi:glycosyltransferase [uncultured Endozoicomonas sp.]|uniref:glycosyltransferase n=1 Tax=uncultured Endozoicomonas sp. TaxID=432652 RepID=UPI00263612D0|nr:glycosyltransferase [uncultured Endozoicomonas sp.]
MPDEIRESLPKSVQEKWVLQLCHGYGMPFHDVARQYAALFAGTEYKVCTVFLTGKKNEQVAKFVGSDDVVFLENTSKDIRGLKLKQIRQVRELCSKRHYEFCIAHRFKSVYIATHVANLFVMGVQHAFGGYQRWGRKFYIQRQKKNLALMGVSNAVRDDIRSCLPKFPQENIVTLYNRIDIQQQKSGLLDREEARRELNLPDDAFVFANVGRLHPDKDQSTLLKAFADVSKKYPKALLVIVGKGRLEESLKAEAKALGIEEQTRFTGVVPEASKYFQAFDGYILTSDHEPFGMVLLEAMLAGLPIAACNTGGASEVVCNTGITFELGDFAELARAMEKILNITDEERRVAAQAMEQRLISHFSDEAVREAFWQLPFVQPFSG